MRDEIILVTGCAGFIGSNLTHRLLAKQYTVVGIDSLNHAYNADFKKENIARLSTNKKFIFYHKDITKPKDLSFIFNKHLPSKIIHLAARTGVRKSLQYPSLYYRVNVLATEMIYRYAVDFGAQQFIFASSSSVYGNSKKIPFDENLRFPTPPSPYAQSKQQAEMHLKRLHQKYRLPTTILRLFSVYGPYGRPDMAPYIFTHAALNQHPIRVFGDGSASRDYTYIDDILDGFEKALDKSFSFEIINLGNTHPISLKKLIAVIEALTKKKAIITHQPSKKEESKTTWANSKKAYNLLKWRPRVQFRKGMEKFLTWYHTNRL